MKNNRHGNPTDSSWIQNTIALLDVSNLPALLNRMVILETKNSDESIRDLHLAIKLLRHMRDGHRLRVLAGGLPEAWWRERSPMLGNLVKEFDTVAPAPTEVRLASALKTGHLEVAAEVGARYPELVATMATDRDREVSRAAVAVLERLNLPAAPPAPTGR
jgi:hypothetical protein